MDEKETASLEGLLKKIIKNLSGKERLTEEEMLGAWEAAVGEKAVRRSRPVALRKGRLSVNVDDSSWLYELTTKKREIIRSLEGRFKGKPVKEIRFRIGEVKGKKADGKKEQR